MLSLEFLTDLSESVTSEDQIIVWPAALKVVVNQMLYPNAEVGLYRKIKPDEYYLEWRGEVSLIPEEFMIRRVIKIIGLQSEYLSLSNVINLLLEDDLDTVCLNQVPYGTCKTGGPR